MKRWAAPLLRNSWKKSSGRTQRETSLSLSSSLSFSRRISLSSIIFLPSVVPLLPSSSSLSLLFPLSLRVTSLAKVSILGASPLLIRLPADASPRRALTSTLQSLQHPHPQHRATARPRIHFGYGAISRVAGNLRKLAASYCRIGRSATQTR